MTSTAPALIAAVPFLDLAAQRDEIEAEVRDGFERVIADTAFVGGPEVAAFEEEFASYCGTGHCIGVANGTDAIELVLRALDIGPGDDVIVPANTFIATAGAVHRTGARPVLVDCDDEHLLIDAEHVAGAVTRATRAVIGVDLYGQRAAFERLAAVVDGRGVALVEDAAQAQGATRAGLGVGAGVVAAATSFYPGKNLGAYGDGGAVVTTDPALAASVRAIGNHGGTSKYEHRVVGLNSRLDALQAVVLRAKLRRLDVWNEARRAAARRYDELLEDQRSIRRTPVEVTNTHVWHLYVVRVVERDRVLAHLQEQGIGAGIHYPTPIHLTPAFAHLGLGRGDFPIAEAASDTMISLPMHPHLSVDDQARVVEVLAGALS